MVRVDVFYVLITLVMHIDLPLSKSPNTRIKEEHCLVSVNVGLVHVCSLFPPDSFESDAWADANNVDHSSNAIRTWHNLRDLYSTLTEHPALMDRHLTYIGRSPPPTPPDGFQREDAPGAVQVEHFLKYLAYIARLHNGMTKSQYLNTVCCVH